MRTVTGYTIAARLCEASLAGGTGLTIKELCHVFSIYWEWLSAIEKLYFKRLALFYKTWRLEHLGIEPTQEDFVSSIFNGRQAEKSTIMMDLYPTAIQLATKNLKELEDIYKNEFQNENQGVVCQ